MATTICRTQDTGQQPQSDITLSLWVRIQVVGIPGDIGKPLTALFHEVAQKNIQREGVVCVAWEECV